MKKSASVKHIADMLIKVVPTDELKPHMSLSKVLNNLWGGKHIKKLEEIEDKFRVKMKRYLVMTLNSSYNSLVW